MRRRADVLLPIELQILDAGIALESSGRPRFHGYLLARTIADRNDARRLMSHGTLYRALGRLERGGLLESEWEDPAQAALDGRPRRRFYRVTLAGARAAADAHLAAAVPSAGRTRPATAS